MDVWHGKKREEIGYRSGGPHFDILDGFSEAQWGADCGSCFVSHVFPTLPKIGGTSSSKFSLFLFTGFYAANMFVWMDGRTVCWSVTCPHC